MIQFFYPFFIPGGLFLALGIMLFSNPPLPQSLVPYLPLLFPITFTLSLVLGLRLKRNRLVLAFLLLGLALGLSLLFPSQKNLTSALALLLPLNLALILLLPEKSFFSTPHALFGSAILIQGLGFFWFNIFRPQHFRDLFDFTLPQIAPSHFLPGIALLISLTVALVLILISFSRRPQPLEAAFFWATLLATLPFHIAAERQFMLLFYSLSGLSLLAGLLETSHHMAYRDELTGIAGRRAFNETLSRLGNRYTLAMLDIDHFKKFNDKHGHDVGDQVLKMVAARVAKVGGGGRAFRYGGEEFVVIFPGRSLDFARSELEALRLTIADSIFVPRGKNRPPKRPAKSQTNAQSNKGLCVTISIGIAEPTGQKKAPESVLKEADQALYRAKQHGRNRICS